MENEEGWGVIEGEFEYRATQLLEVKAEWTGLSSDLDRMRSELDASKSKVDDIIEGVVKLYGLYSRKMEDVRKAGFAD